MNRYNQHDYLIKTTITWLFFSLCSLCVYAAPNKSDKSENSATPVKSQFVNPALKSNTPFPDYQWFGEVDKADKKTGQWVYREPGGHIKKITHYVANKLQGTTITFYDNGNKLVEFNYTNGVVDGPYKKYYKNGVLAQSKNYRMDVLVGVYKNYYPSGRLRVVKHYTNNIINGKYTSYYDNPKNTVNKTGEYKMGRKIGVWHKWTSYGANEFVENYVNNHRNGLNYYYIFGNLFRSENYVKGELNGKFTQYYLDKNKRIHIEGQYKKGINEGQWIYWRYSGGKKQKMVTYVNGYKQGLYNQYDDQGRL